MDHCVLIDGHHLMYRAYWAIPRTLVTSKGEQVNAVFGVASMLLNILQKEEPDSLIFCFDAGEETFRHQQNDTYKDGRAETPDDFYVQIPRIMELIDVFGFPSVSDKEYEADDFLCAYARAAEKQGMRTTIVTGDRDALQVASEHIRIAIPHKGYQQAEYLDPAGVEEKYGIRPDQVADYKGLCGDSSDNLPGVQGIGPKTAAKLLQEFGSLDDIYRNIDAVKGSARSKLEKDKEQAYFCQKMAILRDDIPLPISLDDCMIGQIPLADVQSLFQHLEFTMLQRRLMLLQQTPYGQRITGGEVLSAVMDVFGTTEEKSADQLSLFD